MSGNDTLSPEQSRAARRLLNWSRIRLGCRSNVSETTINKLEEGLCVPSVDKLAAIRAVLEAAGVDFTNGDQTGVRVKKAPDNLRRIADEGAALLMAFGGKRYLRCVGGNFLD
jgi:transcriptional regulator with XRE-family HTH domain